MNPIYFHQSLADWYAKNGRHHLPWRQTDDAYKIWVSEVMLQQTQVKTVLERFYFPFLEKFPNINSLAKADLQEVLQLWQGLGYYSRAKNLHKAAQALAAQRANNLPSKVSELMKLSGIGRNTASAIAAFGFHQPVAILEANVKRIIARIFALETPTDKELWHAAEQLLNRQNPYDYNQAMMDVGSSICTPKNPQCTACPANVICKGKQSPESYPQKKAKAKVPTRHQHLLLVTNKSGHFAIRPRTTRFLHGLWEFPQSAKTPIQGINRGEFSHSYSHFKLEAQLWEVASADLDHSWQFKPLSEIATLPLSRTEKKILGLCGQKC